MGEQEHMGGGEGRGRPGPHKQREASVLGGRVVEVAQRDCLLQGPVTPSPSARTSQGAGKNRRGESVAAPSWAGQGFLMCTVLQHLVLLPSGCLVHPPRPSLRDMRRLGVSICVLHLPVHPSAGTAGQLSDKEAT